MQKLAYPKITLAIGAVLTSLCALAASDTTYTLYRDSVTGPGMRLHIATFDAAESLAYNRENCEQARLLFQAQPGVKTRFWCEPGTFKK